MSASGEMDMHLYEKFVDLASKQAGTMATIAELQRESAVRRAQEMERDHERDAILTRIADTLERTEQAAEKQAALMDKSRELAVEALRQHISTTVKGSDRWTKVWLAVLGSTTTIIAAALALLAVSRAHP